MSYPFAALVPMWHGNGGRVGGIAGSRVQWRRKEGRSVKTPAPSTTPPAKPINDRHPLGHQTPHEPLALVRAISPIHPREVVVGCPAPTLPYKKK